MISSYMKEKVAGSSAIRQMFEEGKRLSGIYGAEHVFDYSLGNPNVAPPDKVKESITRILEEMTPGSVHGYMNNSGFVEVRTKIADFEHRTKGVDVNEKHIVMTCGAAGGLNVVLKTLMEPGDELLTFAPYFAEYNHYASNVGCTLKVVPADTKTFQPNLQEFEAFINKHTKVVIINSPNNPSGAIYTEASIKAIAAVLKAKEVEYGHPIVLVSDEPYREIVYDDTVIPYLLNYYHNALVVYSYSKSLSLPGERIGYITINPDFQEVDAVVAAFNVANRILGFVNAPSLFQLVAGDVVDTSIDISQYRKNRDLLYPFMLEQGFECVKPEGTFYLFVKAPIEDELAFCNKAKEYNVLLVPGRAFGCPGYFRMSYCIAYDKVEKSLDAIAKLAEFYRNQVVK